MTFIAFEGIDGTGKSTVMGRVAAGLAADGVNVWTTAEETSTWHGAAVRRAREERLDPLATTLLFVADRAAHVPEIRSHLDADEVVLCDRFLHSTLAYQSVTLAHLLPDPGEWLLALHAPWCPTPDHVVLLVGDPAACVERAAGRGPTDPYEKVAFLAQVQEAYQRLATQEPSRFTVIDTEGGLESATAKALAAVSACLA